MSATAAAREAATLHARAVELARPLDDDAQDGRLALLVLEVGGQQVALPVADLREVRPPSPVTPVPGGSSVLAGLVGGRGAGLAAVSLAALLGRSAAVALDEQWVAVLDHPTAPLGLLADAAVDIVTVDSSTLSLPTGAGELVTALLPGGALLLDAAALLRDPRLSLDPLDPTKEPA